MRINFLSIEKYLPTNLIFSETLDHLVDGVKGRIEKNTGVRTRYHINSQESVCEMGARALLKALDKAHLNAKDIDLLIFCGASFDFPVPHNSVIIKSKITDDKVNFPCFDIDSTCLSFLNALDIANLYLSSGRYKRVAIVSSEVSSAALTPNDEKVFGLFGDASVATIIESSNTKGYQIKYVDFANYPSGAMYAHVPIGGAVNRGFIAGHNDSDYFFKMESKKLIKLTLEHLNDFINKMEQSIQSKITDFDRIITHQTSKFGNEYFIKHFNVDASKVIETLSIYGNCISASIPLGLEFFFNECHPLESESKLLLLGSGAGLSLGTLVLES